MKKIIYALVIMIAAGSLFTSCIEQVEPDGIKNLRDAKAQYYLALAKLRAADEAYRQAEALVKQAEARYEDALTAAKNAETERLNKMAELDRELKALQNQAYSMEMELRAAQIAQQIDAIAKQMELAEKQHEIDLIDKQKDLAQANEALRVALREIALAAQDLTTDEKNAVIAAAEAYYTIFDKVQNQKIKVMEAELALAKAKKEKEIGQYNPDYTWDSDSHAYITMKEAYENQIAFDEFMIAYYQAQIAAIPEFTDLKEWEKIINGLQAEADELEYSRHEIVEEVSAYWASTVHDGIKAYNDAVDAWVEANKKPAASSEQPKWKDGQTSYTLLNDIKKDVIDEKEHKAGETFGVADDAAVAKIPTLEYKTTPAYQKFSFLINSYRFLISPADDTKDIVYWDGSDIAVAASYDMKEFLLGDENGAEGTQKFKNDDYDLTADYGLYGAVSVLKRDKVLNPDKPADTAKARKAAQAAKDLWQADHDTLAAGLLKYKPYVDAKAALDSILDDLKTNRGTMANAVDKLFESLRSNNSTGLSKNDSTEIMKAFAAFADARIKLLGSENEFDGKVEFDTPKLNPDLYYWASALVDGKWQRSNMKFTDLTYQLLKDKTYFGRQVKESVVGMYYPGYYSGIAHMAYQLLNPTISDMIRSDYNPKNWVFNETDINADNNVALYGKFEYHPKAGKKDAYISLKGETEEFIPKTVTDAQDAITAAINDYKKVYERYWNDTYPATITWDMDEKAIKAELKANPENDLTVYTLDTWTKPFFIVTFSGKNNWDATNAVGAILGSVDKNAVDANATNILAGISESVVLGTAAKPTDLNNYLYAEYAYQLALKPATGDIAVIEAWVKAVEKALNDSHANSGEKARKAFEADSAVWAASKKKNDDYDKALKEFTGTDSKGNANGIKKITGTYDSVSDIQYGFEFVDVKVGEWIKSLGGKQLELAEQYLGKDFPTMLKDWKDRDDQLSEQIFHNEQVMAALKPAYYAAAKASGDAEFLEAADYDELMKNYKQYVKDAKKSFNNAIAAFEDDIDACLKAIEDFESNVPVADINIAKAQADLEKEQLRLNGLEEVLKGAKENLDRILQYIMTLDANFVIPTGLDYTPVA